MDTPKESEPGTSDQANCGHFDTATADVGLKMDSGTLARIDTGGVAGAELPLDDSGECPQLDASLPPPPERSPPPLLPNDEDDGELGTVDDLLKIKNTGFFLEQPVLNNEIGGSLLASISLDGTAQQSTNRPSLFDVGVNRAQAFRGPKETEEEVSGVLRKSSIDVVPENTPPEETIQTKSPDAVQLAGNNTTANLKRTFESAGMYTIASPYAPSSLVGPSARPSPGASNLYGRVRNPSANSGCGGGLALLRAGGYGRPEYNQAGSGGSERELPQARGSLLAIYDTALGKDKTQRWSLAGTAPEVALLRLKLENVERELKELRGKHETTMNDYQAILHQLEICRAAKCRQDVDLSNVSAELTQTKAEFETSCQQRMAMERQIAEWRFKLQSKQIELEDLRQQTREMSRQPGELASKLMEEYEELRMERDNLREQCRFLDNRQSELQAALHSSESEACQMRSRYERELDEMRLKNSSLESRHVAVYQQLHRMVQERDLLRNEREMLQQQLDDACADRTRLLNFRQKKESDYEQLRQQHESAVTEYHRVMSERDSILKENERHSEEKSQLSKKLKSLESDYHSALDQLKNLELQLHTFQHQQQQQTPHKFESSREDLMSFNSSSSHSIQHTPATTVRRMLPAIPVMDANSGMAHNPFVEQRSIASSESEVALITSRAQEEELDKVRRQMDTMKEQVELTRQQLDDAKTRRDWALSERERIVAERDSMRAMCDTLRRERDEAITRLATAIRDTDELQRQKQLAERECRKLRERMELELKQRLTQAGGGNQMNGCSPSNSRDSAIDADMAEWEVETVEVNVDSGRKHADLGIELGGGRDDPTFGGTVPIYVKCLSKTSKYEGALRPYDCIVQVNNIDVTNMERRSVLDILRNSTEVKMVIRRRRLIGMKLISVTLNSAGEGDMGVDLEDGVYVNRIKTSSPAARAGNLAVGDRLVYVNDIPVHGKAASEVHELLQNCRDRSVVLAVMKSPPVMSPTTSWPGGFVNNVTNPGSGVGQLPLRTSGANVSAGHNFLQASSVCNAANRDESVQTLASSSEHLLADQNLSSSGSCLTLPRKQEKQESLLDKVHDKFFRKDKDKKSTVKAVANIAMDQPISCEHKHGSPYVRMRYIQGNSICSGPASSIGRCGTSCSPEQQVLQQLDRILEDEVPPVNKSLANVTNYEKSSGGTWPKSRGVVQPPTVSSGVSTLSQQQSKRAHSNKKPVFSVFQQPSSPLAADLSRQISKDQNMDDFVSPLVSSPLPPPHYPAPMRSHPTNPAMNRRRPGEICRPQSYHPAVPVNSNSSSSSAGAGRFGSPLPSVSVAALTAPGRKLVETLTPAAGSGGGTNSPSYHNRPPSAQSNRRRLANRPISYYEQTYADQFSIPRSTPAQVVKELHQTHFAFVTPVRQSTQSPRQPQLESANKSSSPWPPRSPTSLNQTGPLFEQLDDSSSVGSLTSPAPSLYAHSRTKTSGYNRKGYGVPSLRSPSQGDVRTIQIEKQFASEGLGIRIISHGNGVFISAVEKDSLASKHGLQVGDQLLDVCGINMRSANLQLATNVLSQLVRFGQITLTVQYDQNRYLTAAADYHHHQHSATSTPRATPNSLTDSYVKHSSTSRGHGQAQQSRETLGGEEGYVTPWSEPRFVFVKREISVWPFTLVGGNATGICVDTVKENEDSDSPGNLRCGDQVLEFDGVDFRKLTMEQAMFEMQQRPMGAEVSMLVQYNEAKYQRSKRGAGDLFYIRVNVDRQAENRDELSFRTGDILRIDNSVFNGVFGLWRAWAVDQEGRELFCGIIPSKIRLEDEIFRRSGSEISGGDGGSEGGGSRRGTIRRSLKFIRRSSRSTHQRAPSRDSKETMEPGDAVLADELYQRVERLDYKQKRPVLIVGALVDVLVAKLMEEYPNMFAHCAPECVQPTSVSILNQGLQQNIYIDYQKRDKLFEITSVAALKALMDQGFHCILRVSLSAVERLHRLQIYPVVVYVKFKDYKQIKELSEGQVNSKEAKEMCQQSAALETEYHQMFTAIIQAQHCNVKYICQRMADAVEHEQKKTLWIMSPENL